MTTLGYNLKSGVILDGTTDKRLTLPQQLVEHIREYFEPPTGEQIPHDCDAADCCESPKAYTPGYRDAVDKKEARCLETENFHLRQLLTMRETDVRELSERESKLGRRAHHLEERNAHLKEMLADKGQRLIDTSARLKRAYELLGWQYVENEGR